MTVFEEHRLPHDRVTHLAMGHLPCQYVKLECLRGSPVSLAKVEALGVPLKALQARGGQAGLAPLLFEGTKDVLFRRRKEGVLRSNPIARPPKNTIPADADTNRLVPSQTQLHSEAAKNEAVSGAPLPNSKLQWIQADDSSSSASEESEEDVEEGAEESDCLRAASEGGKSIAAAESIRIIGGASEVVAEDHGAEGASWSDLL
jgi:hypothetical protein